MKINFQKINLLKTSLIISLIGIFLLLLLSNILEPKITKIKDINPSFLDKAVKVQGQILNIRTYEKFNLQVISIQDNTGKIEVVVNQISDLQNLQNITIIGKITEYEKDLQIQADKIFLE